jgi:hypothetical protein
MSMKKSIFLLMFLFVCVWNGSIAAQETAHADVASYQLGVVAEALPGSDLTYTIAITNYGPSTVNSFYILDGWTVNDEGLSSFVLPVAQPDFGNFTLLGAWEQVREDEIVMAWLLEGALAPGDTLQFDWIVQVNSAYQGVLVNWMDILSTGELAGLWQARSSSAFPSPPPIQSASDANPSNNRTTDGVTIVTTTPTGQGIDLALYQTGILTEIPAGQPLESTWLVANLGPQLVTQFYVVAGGSLNSDGSSPLAQPFVEPNFGNFQVLGTWQQSTSDEKLWLWLLQGPLPAGGSVVFEWKRSLIPEYRGDFINWAGISGHDVPEGSWITRGSTTLAPQPIGTLADSFPENDNALDALTTIQE